MFSARHADSSAYYDRANAGLPLVFAYAARTLIAGRLFTAIAVRCLALAIATNTTMFSVFDVMFLRPPRFPEAARR